MEFKCEATANFASTFLPRPRVANGYGHFHCWHMLRLRPFLFKTIVKVAGVCFLDCAELQWSQCLPVVELATGGRTHTRCHRQEKFATPCNHLSLGVVPKLQVVVYLFVTLFIEFLWYFRYFVFYSVSIVHFPTILVPAVCLCLEKCFYSCLRLDVPKTSSRIGTERSDSRSSTTGCVSSELLLYEVTLQMLIPSHNSPCAKLPKFGATMVGAFRLTATSVLKYESPPTNKSLLAIQYIENSGARFKHT